MNTTESGVEPRDFKSLTANARLDRPLIRLPVSFWRFHRLTEPCDSLKQDQASSNDDCPEAPALKRALHARLHKIRLSRMRSLRVGSAYEPTTSDADGKRGSSNDTIPSSSFSHGSEEE